MKINNQRIFEGRNIYSHRKCIRLDVDLEGYCETPTKDIDGFNERLLSYVPELYTHRCGIDIEGGFVQRLKEGTYFCLLYTSPSPRDLHVSRMPSSA